MIDNVEVHRVLVDQGSSLNIVLYEAFRKIQLQDHHLRPHECDLINFTGIHQRPKGYIEMRITLGDGRHGRIEHAKILVVDIPSAYNAILR